MKSLLQRVSQASVTIEGRETARIGPGLLVFFCAEVGDSATQLDYHVKKLADLRIFSDEQGKMNRSLRDIDGALLVVSQFTLAGDCRKGNRPGFSSAMAPDEAKRLYEGLIQRLREAGIRSVETGVFGADMQVALVNEGPVTLWLEN